MEIAYELDERKNMSDDFPQDSSRAKYIGVACAAVFFLLLLPGFVLAFASNMTGVELSIVRDENPVPEHRIIQRRRVGFELTLWLRVPESTSKKEMNQIIHHIVSNVYSGERSAIFHIYNSIDTETNMPKRPSTHESDQTFKWTLSSGIRRVK